MRNRAFFLVFLISMLSCSDEDSSSCTVCSSDQTPEFELCRLGNGNAAVNGQDTGIEHDTYLAGLQEAGANCEN